MVPSAEEPAAASGGNALESKTPDEMSPEEYKQVKGFLDQLAKHLGLKGGGQEVSKERSEQSEGSAPFAASTHPKSVQLPEQAVAATATPPPEREVEAALATQQAVAATATPPQEPEVEAAIATQQTVAATATQAAKPEEEAAIATKQTVAATATQAAKPEEEAAIATKQEPLDQADLQTKTALEGLLALLEPDQTDPQTVTGLEGLLALLEPDWTESRTAAALEEFIIPPVDKSPSSAPAKPFSDQLEASRLSQPDTGLNQKAMEGLLIPPVDQPPSEAPAKPFSDQLEASRLSQPDTGINQKAMEGLLIPPVDQPSDSAPAKSAADELEASRLSQPSTQLNQNQTQLDEKVDASSKRKKKLLLGIANSVRRKAANKQKKDRTNLPSFTLIGVGLAILILASWGIYEYFTRTERRLDQKVAQALASAPELVVYRLEADVQGRRVQLNGKLPNRQLRDRAEQIIRAAAPGFEIDDNIIVVERPPDRVQTATEVQQVVKALNQIDGISISAQFEEGTLTLEGTVLQLANLQNITQAFEQIPGVQSVTNHVKIEPLSIATRIYYRQNSATVEPLDIGVKLVPIKQLMQRYPKLQLRIVGHGHASERSSMNLALERAQTVQTLLEDLGVDRRRTQAIGRKGSPPDVDPNQERWLGRCVLFEIIQPNPQTAQSQQTSVNLR